MDKDQKPLILGGALLVGAGLGLMSYLGNRSKTVQSTIPALKHCILAIDQGTTSSRVLVINENLNVVGSASRDVENMSPQPGHVSQDPEKIYDGIVECLKEVCQKYGLSAENVKAIGITNQRETTVAFDRVTGKKFADTLVWLDKRTAGVVKEMKDKAGGDVDKHRPVCGLPLNTYFSAVKMKWLL